jgi:hypothetical protein
MLFRCHSILISYTLNAARYTLFPNFIPSPLDNPALANIKSHLNDPDEYVQRVALATLKRLENR